MSGNKSCPDIAAIIKKWDRMQLGLSISLRFEIGDRVEFKVGHSIIEGRIKDTITDLHIIQSDALINYHILEKDIVSKI